MHAPAVYEGEPGEILFNLETVCKFVRVTHYQNYSEVTFNTLVEGSVALSTVLNCRFFHGISVVSTNRLILLQTLIDCGVYLLKVLFDSFSCW